eukprot:s1701_g2.t1
MVGLKRFHLLGFCNSGAIWLCMVAAVVTDRLNYASFPQAHSDRIFRHTLRMVNGMSSHLPPFPTLTSPITGCKMPDLVRNEHHFQKI